MFVFDTAIADMLIRSASTRRNLSLLMEEYMRENPPIFFKNKEGTGEVRATRTGRAVVRWRDDDHPLLVPLVAGRSLV